MAGGRNQRRGTLKPEQTEERPPQRGAYLHPGPEALYEQFGFVRDDKIAKWRWVMRAEVPAT